MLVLFTESKFWDKHRSFQKLYEAQLLKSAEEVAGQLEHVPKDITFLVQTNGYEAIPEYGSGASTHNSKLIILTIDPALPYGEEIQLRYAHKVVYHEMSHAARFEQGLYHKSFIDRCILEGLATAYERDAAGAEPLYGQYNASECQAWIEEIETKQDSDSYSAYMFRHPDGRRWIGYKVGTWIVDQAIKKSGKTIVQLTELECSEVRRLANI